MERIAVKKIRDLLDNKFPGFYFKSHGSEFQMSGLPDIIGCYKGRFIGIEVKDPEGNHPTSELQKKRIREIRQAGGIAFTADTPQMAERLLVKYGAIPTTKKRVKKKQTEHGLQALYGAGYRKDLSRNKNN